MNPSIIRILLVDDQNIIRQGIQALLEPSPKLKVVGTVKDGSSAIEQVGILMPDIVLMDIEMSGMSGITATQKICQQFPKTKVLVFSSHENQEYVIQALQAGAEGYLLKNALVQDLEQAILSVYRGHSQIESKLLKKVFAENVTPFPRSNVLVKQNGFTRAGKQSLQEISPKLNSNANEVSNSNRHLQEDEESAKINPNESLSKISKSNVTPVSERSELEIRSPDRGGETEAINIKKFSNEQVGKKPFVRQDSIKQEHKLQRKKRIFLKDLKWWRGLVSAKNAGMQVFTFIWFGQTISLVGSELTSFALGVWIYQQTGSVTQFSLISLFTSLPKILISPIAGTLVDKFSRRRIMVFSDLGAGTATGVIAFLLVTGDLSFWHICACATVSSCFNAFQWPAYTSAITLLVTKKDLARANGMLQIGESVGSLVAPMLGGLLLLAFNINGIIFIDFATFIFAVSVLLLVRFPKQYIDRHYAEKTPWFEEASYGLVYLIKREGLFALLLFFAINNFLAGIVQMLFTPLVLSFASATDLGTILTISGVGMLISSVLITTIRMPPYLVPNILSFKLLGGISIVCAGLCKFVPLLALIAFLFFFTLPIIRSSSQIIFQKKVPSHIQGRVFATIMAISTALQPFAYAVAGPLADKIFEPLMAANGLLAGSIGKIIGIGQGGGISLMFIVVGILTVLTTIIAYQYKPLRLLEKQLPDALSEQTHTQPVKTLAK